MYKHGLNLKTALKKPKKRIIKKRDSSVLNIGASKRGFQIYKCINGKNQYYGRYYSLEDAQTVRDKLIECDWDKNQLPSILEETGIKMKRRTCKQYTLWDNSHIEYNPRGFKHFRVRYNRRGVNVGCFLEFVSCDVIYNLIEWAISDEGVS